MAYFDWNSNIILGIEEIDAQHRSLVDLINELHSAMKQGKGQTILDEILLKLKDYINFHFNFEESLLKKYNYPEFNSHKQQHTLFINKIKDFEERRNKGQVALTIELLSFLKDWLNHHIMNIDKKYVNFLLPKLKA